jgi:hypothetical protein
VTDEAEKGFVAENGAPAKPEPGRIPKKDTTALSNALRANLQKRKQAQRARKQERPATDSPVEDEAKWTK